MSASVGAVKPVTRARTVCFTLISMREAGDEAARTICILCLLRGQMMKYECHCLSSIPIAVSQVITWLSPKHTING